LKAVEPATDDRLAIEAAKRDPSRFAELYENNFEQVYAYIARHVGNREEAQDLTAEVFHHALANIHDFVRKVQFTSDFTIDNGHLTNPNTQDKMDHLSQQA
jgi:DNA-directed RNA polymerase specialized sigma24 family protein